MFDDIPLNRIPKDVDFFNIDEDKYPLLKEKEDYILETRLERGDCMYLPGRWWFQTKTVGDGLSFLMNFEYEPMSKY